MTMSFELVTDSCCNLTEETIDRYGLHVLPLTFMADGEDTVYQSYLKGEKSDLSQFYKMMRDGKVFRTSLPNLSNTEALFRSLLDAGRDILYLGFSSGLSGTYEATELLAKQLRGEYPDRKIYTVDTLAASGARACWCGMRANMRKPARVSMRCATGSKATSCAWRTGSRWTTSCSCGAAGACRRPARGPARC